MWQISFAYFIYIALQLLEIKDAFALFYNNCKK